MIKVTDKLWVSGQPTEADVAAAGEAGIRRIVNNRPENEEPTQPSMADAAALAGQAGMDFVNIPVAPGRYTLARVAHAPPRCGRSARFSTVGCRPTNSTRSVSGSASISPVPRTGCATTTDDLNLNRS